MIMNNHSYMQNEECNEVTLLKRNHTYIRIPEDQLTEELLEDSIFYMVKTSNELSCRNFIVAKPNKKLIFDKAIIDFKLSMYGIYNKYESFNAEIDELASKSNNQIQRIETSSLTLLISIINIIDRLILVDMLLDDENVGDRYSVYMQYMHITLYKNNEISYESGYTNNPDIIGYNPYKITKSFSKIYKPITYLSGITSGDTLFMSTNGYWAIDTDFSHKKGMIGIISPSSATVTFCTKREYDKLLSVNKSSINIFIYGIYDTIDVNMTDTLTEAISNGQYENLTDIDGVFDFFFDNSIYTQNYRNPVNKLAEFIAHSEFLIDIINLMHNEYFYFGEVKEDCANSVLYIRLESKDGNYRKHIYMTKDTMVSPNEIFNSL